MCWHTPLIHVVTLTKSLVTSQVTETRVLTKSLRSPSWHATVCNKDREAGPSDRPQKIEKSYLGSELLHHVHTMARSGSWPLIDYLVSNDVRIDGTRGG